MLNQLFLSVGTIDRSIAAYCAATLLDIRGCSLKRTYNNWRQGEN
ncbi:hypothetical protein [Undibacterium terreum]|uniref:Uncharacterized protein n=1 Tax=Undibacterium terreum TaxID=1224302 RepID=A0A916U8U4_9BURK|nr:hypothetical protein [Undibacterium terreum]GGC64093.1 hypothetical protein GCM10011396_08780 [Undibacterium terreum]